MKTSTIKKIIGIELSCLALILAALHNQAHGYNFFDTEDGNNIMCDIDPTCRQLTDNEIELAREYFGDEIDYKKVKFFDRPRFFLPNSITKYFNGTNPGMMVSAGNIYAYIDHAQNIDDWGEDDDEESSAKASYFLHEITHVWQQQNQYGYGKRMYNGYEYDISKYSSFFRYNHEQQAEIIRTLYSARKIVEFSLSGVMTGRPIDEWCAKEHSHFMKASQELPIQPFALCVN